MGTGVRAGGVRAAGARPGGARAAGARPGRDRHRVSVLDLPLAVEGGGEVIAGAGEGSILDEEVVAVMVGGVVAVVQRAGRNAGEVPGEGVELYEPACDQVTGQR